MCWLCVFHVGCTYGKSDVFRGFPNFLFARVSCFRDKYHASVWSVLFYRFPPKLVRTRKLRRPWIASYRNSENFPFWGRFLPNQYILGLDFGRYGQLMESITRKLCNTKNSLRKGTSLVCPPSDGMSSIVQKRIPWVVASGHWDHPFSNRCLTDALGTHHKYSRCLWRNDA